MQNLNDKQALFCAEYLKDLNATQAAIRAGYSENTARQIGSKLLTKVDVQDYISELMRERVEQTKIDAAYVLKRLVEIDQLDAADILDDDGAVKPISEWPIAWRRSVSGIETFDQFEGKGAERAFIGVMKKIKMPDKVKNIELLGKHIDVNAFVEKKEIKGTMDLAFSDLMDELSDDDL